MFKVVIPSTPVEEEIAALRDKLLFALEIFPFISRSMIHMAIGTAISRRLWSPILDELIAEGIVCEITVFARTPAGRNQQYTLYHLKTRQYQTNHDNITFTPASADASLNATAA